MADRFLFNDDNFDGCASIRDGQRLQLRVYDYNLRELGAGLRITSTFHFNKSSKNCKVTTLLRLVYRFLRMFWETGYERFYMNDVLSLLERWLGYVCFFWGAHDYGF